MRPQLHMPARLVEAQMPIETESEHAQIGWAMVFKPLAHAMAFGRDIGRHALPSSKAIWTDSEWADQSAPHGHFARRRIVHAQAAPFVEFEDAQPGTQLRLNLTSPGEQFVSPFRCATASENQQRIEFAAQLRLDARRGRPAHGLVVGGALDLNGQDGFMSPTQANNGHLKADSTFTRRPVRCDSWQAFITSSTCSPCSGVMRLGLPVNKHSAT